jgi:transcriptional regulator with XRE-family HTH domain
MIPRMTVTRPYVQREATRRLRRVKAQIGGDLGRIRIDAGVSVAGLARVVGVDDAHIGRIEAGVANPSLEVLVALGVALGADLGVRYFAGSGPRIHDRFQAPIQEALLRALHPRWRPDLEVPVERPARGVIDSVLWDSVTRIVVAAEIQSDLQRLEQQLRWGHEKAEALALRVAASIEHPRQVSQLLVLRSTVRTRELARQYDATMRTAFPARTADAFDALRSPDQPWPGSAIVWARLHGTRAWLMRLPPPGVAVGR